jgi:DNA-binding NtrC family response regulator
MCLDRIRQRVFSAVLVSADLPDQEGLSLLDTIRTMHPTLPVIVLSFEGPSPIARQRGAFAVLRLPYEPNELYDILQRAIRIREDQ